MNGKKAMVRMSMLIAALGLLLSGCAARKALWGDPGSGLILQYRLEKGKTLDYQVDNSMVQNMEIMGNAMKTDIRYDLSFSVASAGKVNEDLSLDMKINRMSMSVTSPMGEMSPDLSSVAGRSFNMLLSVLGEEKNLAGAEKITYSAGPGGQRSVASEFQVLFPNMAGRPLRVGDTWTYPDTMEVRQENFHLIFAFRNVNTLAGLETVSGKECVKVTANVTGTVTGEGEQMGQKMTWDGAVEARDTWYFAYKEGILVQSSSEGLTESTIAVTGAQNMTIPMTMESRIRVKLVQ